jgi:quercetin dioxygenase-like cupin family protein
MNSPSSAVLPRVRHADAAGYVAALEGIERKTLVDGGRTQLVEFRLAGEAVIPAHHHPQEQTGYLAAGRLILTIAGVDHAMNPGDAWTIPGGVEHGARILRDSVAIEVFSPVRADYRLSSPQPGPESKTPCHTGSSS